jgi:hypothetical protein
MTVFAYVFRHSKDYSRRDREKENKKEANIGKMLKSDESN